ncbi:MAG TPA: glycosyltransferase [Candidatus Caenarcaniphilales bacterium]
MILFSVGTEQFPFDRLMIWMQTLLTQGFIQEEIVVQYGSCTTQLNGVRAYSLLAESQFQELIQQARLVVSHCGEGTILLLETTSKPYILVPRCQSLGEHVDDHQVELAVALAQREIPVAWSPGDLVRFIASPRRTSPITGSFMDLCQHLKNRFG